MTHDAVTVDHLEPCPFCAEKAELGQWGNGFFVGCVNSECGTQPETGSFDTPEIAIAAWNTRPAMKEASKPAVEGDELARHAKVRLEAMFNDLRRRLLNLPRRNTGGHLDAGLDEAQDAINEIEHLAIKSLSRINEVREALEYIARHSGKTAEGFIDWQRSFMRVQEVARTALNDTDLGEG